jgi:hypothetical protein
MQVSVKKNVITTRIDNETYNRLVTFENESGKPIGTIVRNFIEVMLLHVDKTKNEMVNSSLDAVFDIIEMDNKIIKKYQKSIYNLQAHLTETIEEMNKANESRMIHRSNLFTGIETNSNESNLFRNV